MEQKQRESCTAAAAIYVNGYCATSGNAVERLQRAKSMSNRVKSELITRCGLTERNFITRNAATAYEREKNIMLVSITIPAQKAEPTIEMPQEQPRQETKLEPPKQEKKEPEQREETTIVVSPVPKANTNTSFNLHTNLLYWAVATPNIGVEWRINPSYGIIPKSN